MVTYKINSIFSSIQGEGIDTGCAAIFVRMADCNLNCSFCDTDFNQRFEKSDVELFKAIKSKTGETNISYVIFTGGEPLLQNLHPVTDMLLKAGYKIGLETNGMIRPWFNHPFHCISFSPKVSLTKISLQSCDSLKILYPYLPQVRPENYKNFPAKWRGIQPLDTGDVIENRYVLRLALREIRLLGGQWRLSPQVHKLLNLE